MTLFRVILSKFPAKKMTMLTDVEDLVTRS